MFDVIGRWFGLRKKPSPRRMPVLELRDPVPLQPLPYRHPPPKGPRRPSLEQTHDTIGSSGAGGRVAPAMAVMRSHAVQMPPPVAASPGLPPVDPANQPSCGAQEIIALAQPEVSLEPALCAKKSPRTRSRKSRSGCNR